MSGPWDAKYTEEQREAAAAAYCDGMTANEVVQTAADGRLKYRGEPLAPFEIKASTVASYASKMRRRREGRAVSKVAELPHRDALENLRIRSISAADALLAAYEKTLERKPENADPERLRQILRVQLEAARLPTATSARPATEQRDVNGQRDTRTRGGPAGALLREYRASTEPAQSEAQHTADNGDSSAAQHTQPRLNERSDDGPGALSSEQSAASRALAVGG